MNAATLLVLGYGYSLATAQPNTTSQYIVFTNTFLSDYVAGSTFPLAWTVGDGKPLTLTLGNSSWSETLLVPTNATIVTDAPPYNATGSVMATSTFYDSECGCTETGSALVAATPSTYYKPTRGCPKTSMVPLATNKKPSAANYSLLAASTLATPIAPSPSHGAASQMLSPFASLFAIQGSVLALSMT